GEFSRGLCLLKDTIVASGSSPAAISVYNLAANEKLFSVQISEDENSAIHSIVAWPFDWFFTFRRRATPVATHRQYNQADS
ncbi:MAG: hypothetical protein ACR2QS_13700, partial [Woeseiaceae bacterium]